MSEDKKRPEEEDTDNPLDSSEKVFEDSSATESPAEERESMGAEESGADRDPEDGSRDSEDGPAENESPDSSHSMDAEIIGDFSPHPMLPVTETLPGYLPILPIAERPFFPGITLPIQISNNDFIPIIEYALKQSNRFFGAVLVSDLNEDAPVKSEYYDVGTAIKILRADQSEDSLQLLVQTVRRFSRKKVI